MPKLKGNLDVSYNFFVVLGLVSFIAYSSVQSVVSEAMAEYSEMYESSKQGIAPIRTYSKRKMLKNEIRYVMYRLIMNLSSINILNVLPFGLACFNCPTALHPFTSLAFIAHYLYRSAYVVCCIYFLPMLNI